MSENHIRNVIEAALLAGGKPLQVAEIAQLFDEEARPEKEQIVEDPSAHTPKGPPPAHRSRALRE
jgi:chromosome segregation and condensation protein ScpB